MDSLEAWIKLFLITHLHFIYWGAQAELCPCWQGSLPWTSFWQFLLKALHIWQSDSVDFALSTLHDKSLASVLVPSAECILMPIDSTLEEPSRNNYLSKNRVIQGNLGLPWKKLIFCFLQEKNRITISPRTLPDCPQSQCALWQIYYKSRVKLNFKKKGLNQGFGFSWPRWSLRQNYLFSRKH